MRGLRLQVVELARKHRSNDAGIDELGPNFEPGLERAHEVLDDLQWRLELGGEQRRRFVYNRGRPADWALKLVPPP